MSQGDQARAAAPSSAHIWFGGDGLHASCSEVDESLMDYRVHFPALSEDNEVDHHFRQGRPSLSYTVGLQAGCASAAER